MQEGKCLNEKTAVSREEGYEYFCAHRIGYATISGNIIFTLYIGNYINRKGSHPPYKLESIYDRHTRIKCIYRIDTRNIEGEGENSNHCWDGSRMLSSGISMY